MIERVCKNCEWWVVDPNLEEKLRGIVTKERPRRDRGMVREHKKPRQQHMVRYSQERAAHWQSRLDLSVEGRCYRSCKG